MANKIEAEIARLMKTGMTEEEARECALYDAEVEAGHATEYDLTPEQQKAAKKYTNVDTKKPSTKPRKPPERKPNEAKRKVIKFIEHCLSTSKNQLSNIKVTNIERQIDFTYQGAEFSITLTQHRPPKT